MSFYIYTFPDRESLLVSAVRDGMTLLNHPVFADVRVATKKTDKPGKQVIIGYDGGIEVNAATREEDFRVLVYADDYKTASELASQTESAILAMKFAPNGISNTWLDQSAIRIENPTGKELREITATALIKGKKIQINP